MPHLHLRKLGLFGAAAAAAVGLVLYLGCSAQSGVAPASSQVSSTAQSPAIATHFSAAVGRPVPPAQPTLFAGTSAPRLPLEAGGHLAHTHTVRDFFDYFLTAQDDLPAAAVDQLVRQAIAAQLDGTAAAAEAVAVWQRYTAYRTALDQLPPSAGVTADNASNKPDFDALQLALEQHATLANRLMGAWSEVFFGDEMERSRTDLARLRIASDPSLSEAGKTARLTALDATLPPAQRAARERIQQQQASIAAIAQLQQHNASPDAIRAQVTQTLGADAAQRVVQMQQDEQAWQGKYTDYTAQRGQIDKLNLSPQDHDNQVTQLRQQFFPNPGDAMRAASLDQGSGH